MQTVFGQLRTPGYEKRKPASRSIQKTIPKREEPPGGLSRCCVGFRHRELKNRKHDGRDRPKERESRSYNRRGVGCAAAAIVGRLGDSAAHHDLDYIT